MMSKIRAATIVAVLTIGGAAMPAQAQDCRAIADPTQRLACYDRQQGAPTVAPPAPARDEPVSANRTALPQPKAEVPKSKVGFTSSIAAIAPLNFGLYELTLADGSVWSTTTSGGFRPVVGDVVSYRRSMLGAHYFDIKGKRPVSVRRER